MAGTCYKLKRLFGHDALCASMPSWQPALAEKRHREIRTRQRIVLRLVPCRIPHGPADHLLYAFSCPL